MPLKKSNHKNLQIEFSKKVCQKAKSYSTG